MSTTLACISAPFDFSWFQQIVVFNGAVPRLLAASILGGVIGLEREYKRRSAGVRTNLLICLGAAFFTLLSAVLAGDASPNKGQVASNIVQGIGFLGAGLILHNRSRISGLTSAATVWVVASIGMACGAGLPVLAVAGAALHLVAVGTLPTAERVLRRTSGTALTVEATRSGDTLAHLFDVCADTGTRGPPEIRRRCGSLQT